MVCGSKERAIGTATRIPMLSYSQTPQIPFFLDGALPSLQHKSGEYSGPTLQSSFLAEESPAWARL